MNIPFIAQRLNTIKKLDYNDKAKIASLIVLLALSLVLRLSVVKAQTSDYVYFVKPWVEFMQAHGLHAFHYDFADYNTPYLLLLYLASLTHLPTIAIVKGLSILFDLFLAYAIMLVVGFYRPIGYVKFYAGIVALFLPTVFINSSLWGQCDSIYNSFLLFAIYATLKNRARSSWIFWGIAFAFKLQAIFFLPFLLFITLHRRWRIITLLYGLLVVVLLSALPVLEGRSIVSTLGIYVNQTKGAPGPIVLSINAATLYQWLPAHLFSVYFERAGTIFAAAVAVGIASLAFRKRIYNNKEILLVATMTLFAIPFCLPLMHERYFYSAEVMSLILAFVVPRLAFITVIAQVVTLLSYIPYLSWDNQMSPIPLPVLSIFMLSVIGTLAYSLLRGLPNAEKHTVKPRL